MLFFLSILYLQNCLVTNDASATNFVINDEVATAIENVINSEDVEVGGIINPEVDINFSNVSHINNVDDDMNIMNNMNIDDELDVLEDIKDVLNVPKDDADDDEQTSQMNNDVEYDLGYNEDILSVGNYTIVFL